MLRMKACLILLAFLLCGVYCNNTTEAALKIICEEASFRTFQKKPARILAKVVQLDLFEDCITNSGVWCPNAAIEITGAVEGFNHVAIGSFEGPLCWTGNT